ncbi:CBN-PAR-3 protein [Caenorhabditis brenneri]|uniref:CBN-PAR-3 protein n=1 Tax=Caenorhabditis brenneri TaxID=135651 RepID=G0MPH7_CAEBE|nr:CBN-PAR-3 protein [Caenorhabditis brenneri]
MSASSTSSSTSCSQEGDGGEPPGYHHQKTPGDDEGDSTLKKRMQQYGSSTGGGGVYANSTISTLDRSQYHSLPLNGTRRVTVQFGRMKIVVPWKESDQTVGELAEAALVRYKKAKGLTNSDRIRVHRLECASDGGILDMDDVLEEVFDLNYDQILAITDEANGGSTTPTYSQIQKQQHHYAQPLPYSRNYEGPTTPIASAFGSVTVNHQAHRSASPYNVGFARSTSRDLPYPPPQQQKERRDSVVEVSNFDNIPQSGLRVSTPKSEVRKQMINEPILRSSLRTEASGSRAVDDATPTKQPRVTLSPEVEKKLAEQEGNERRSERKKHFEKNPGRFNRGSDRKSRITDALLDARDRIADQLENENPYDEKRSQSSSRGKIEQGPLPATTLITFLPPGEKESEISKQMGIEINAVFDETPNTPSTSEPSSKLNSVQVMKIDESGRVGRDGRIRVGDCILAIDGKPVDQMSVIRARASISELSTLNRPVTLVINRSLESFLDQESAKPIQSALQQANTQYIGHTTIVELIKSSNGFGFTVTGRGTSKGENLFYIGTVKPHGVALGHLKTGDRLLEINGVPTAQYTQPQIVEKLKETMVGAKIRFLVSRVSQSSSAAVASSSSSENKENEETPKIEEEKSVVPAPPKLPLPALMTPPVPKDSPSLSPGSQSRFDLIIPFINGSSSAGLGVSLKARVSKKSNGSKVDCGIFIKNVMHGGAAFKEGGLRVDDRIIGVEDVDLEQLDNREAQAALAKKLKEVGMVSSNVRLTIVRNNEYSTGQISRDLSRITVDASSPAPSSRMSSHTAPDSLLQSPHTRATSSSGADSSHSRQSSSSSAVPAPLRPPTERDSIISDSTNRHDESELPDSDPFNREAPGRKSLSEKRGMGAAADPQHIKLFQEIKHQRQNSAPTSSTQKRSKSQPRSLSQRNYRSSPMKLIDLPQAPATPTASSSSQNQTTQLDDSDMLNRRSQSMESINRPVESILRGTGQINSNSTSKVQFMQKAGPDQHPFPPGAALLRLKSEDSRSRDKSRRKSMGNAMRNFFGFGSKSRDASPEKTPTVELRSVERPKSILDERNKDQRAPPPPPPHQDLRRGSAGNNVFVDYGEPYGLIPQYPHNTTSGYESYADSELYDRYAAHRYYPRGGPIDNDDEFIFRQQSSSFNPPSSYVNYGLPTSHAYHVDARIPSSKVVGGSVSKSAMRRVYPVEYDDLHHPAQHPPPSSSSQASRYQQIGGGGGGGSSGRAGADYHHMFNSWFAYTGGGAIGAAPLIKSSYGPSSSSPVRIATASAIERGESFFESTSSSGGGAPPTSADRRGRSTSSGTIGGGGGGMSSSTSGPSGFYSTKEKYADARSSGAGSGAGSKFNGGSTRLFIPRHGGGLSAAAFATNFGGGGGNEGYETRGGGSPSQYRRRPTNEQQGSSPHRFPQY